jgi:hypothetical protein
MYSVNRCARTDDMSLADDAKKSRKYQEQQGVANYRVRLIIGLYRSIVALSLRLAIRKQQALGSLFAQVGTRAGARVGDRGKAAPPTYLERIECNGTKTGNLGRSRAVCFTKSVKALRIKEIGAQNCVLSCHSICPGKEILLCCTPYSRGSVASSHQI